jgi:MFS family permease
MSQHTVRDAPPAGATFGQRISSAMTRFRGPLAGRYPAVAAMVVFALVPYLALAAALSSITPLIASQLHMSVQTVNLTSGMANAGYAVGTVLAFQLAQHLHQRRMVLLYASLLVIGSVLAAAATNPGMYITGHVLQGLCTSLLLIGAVPPLVLDYPAARLRGTVIILNVCLFGAVALGPLIGGVQASFHGWRPLFWILAAIAAAALALSVLTFRDTPPADPSAPKDVVTIGLAGVGSVAAFYGASELATHSFVSPTTLVPLLGGLTLIVILFLRQYRSRRPLLCVRILNSTFPVAGIVVALCAAAASVSTIALSEALLQRQFPPLHAGLLYFPEFGGAAVAAAVFGLVFRTHLVHYFTLGGMILLGAGIAVLAGAIPPSSTVTLVGSGLIGVGVGASVVPALFIVGFSLRNNLLQGVFSIIELMRAVAAFMIGPILLHFAIGAGGLTNSVTSTVLWICFGLTVGGALFAIWLYLVGNVKPPAPAVEHWFGGGGPAWESPPLPRFPQILGRFGRRTNDGDAEARQTAAPSTDAASAHTDMG